MRMLPGSRLKDRDAIEADRIEQAQRVALDIRRRLANFEAPERIVVKLTGHSYGFKFRLRGGAEEMIGFKISVNVAADRRGGRNFNVTSGALRLLLDRWAEKALKEGAAI